MHATQDQPPPTDALLPLEMARLSEITGERKAKLAFVPTLVLAVLAGAFIAIGGAFYTVVITGVESSLPYGVGRMIGGIAFSLGLVLVIVGGAELFTGNNLIVMAWASRRINTGQVMRNWAIVYAGNFLGAISIAAIVYVAGIPNQDQGNVGLKMIQIAQTKCTLPWIQAIAAGVLCNVLVCLAVWLCISARSVTDKVMCILFPITAFVTLGMEHSVANMYFIPVGLLAQSGVATDATTHTLSWTEFVWGNLLPVTLGNIIGGALMVGMVYWFVYLRHDGNKEPSS